MQHAAEMRRCLVDLDAVQARTLWGHIAPHLPAPRTDAEALVALHMGRTAAASIPLRLRAYSHAWLTERGLPSQLPDRLRPWAERVYPVAVGMVGVAVKSQYPVVVKAIQGAMVDAIEDCYANGDEDPAIVKPQMMAARRREKKALGLLRWGD